MSADTGMTGACEWCGTLTDSDRCSYCGGPRTKAAPIRSNLDRLSFYVAAPAFDYRQPCSGACSCGAKTTPERGAEWEAWVAEQDPAIADRVRTGLVSTGGPHGTCIEVVVVGQAHPSWVCGWGCPR